MDDLISRKAAIDSIEYHIRRVEEPYALSREDKLVNYGLEVAASCVYNLPSAQERKRGRWIETSSGDHWRCSRCHCRAGFWFDEENSCGWSMDMSEWLSDYCPNCGAEMRGEEE